MALAQHQAQKRHSGAPARSPGEEHPPDSRGTVCDRDQTLGELELEVTRLRLREQALAQASQEYKSLSQYYACLFHSGPVGYMVVDRAGTVLEINEAGVVLLHAKREEIIHHPFGRFLRESEQHEFLDHLRRCRTSTRQVISELMLNLRDGRLLPVHLISTRFESDDIIPHYRTAIVDISDQVRSEQALVKTQKNYRNLVNSIEGIVWEGDLYRGEVTFVSAQAQRILGYPLLDWLHQQDFWLKHLHPDDRQRILEARKSLIPARSSFIEEFRMITAAGEILWLRNNVTVIRTGREPLRLQGVMVNITELKEAEAALREERRMLETLNHIGTSLAAELDLEKLVQAVTEAGKQVTGAQFGAFTYKHFNGQGEPFVVHSTPGVPRDTFASLPQPRQPDSEPAAPTAKEIIRIDDVLQDPRSRAVRRTGIGPRLMPVRSYLAVPVVSRSGEVLGGLLFGHPSPGVFTERAQHLLEGIAAEAGIALDNARLYQAVSKSESHFRQLADAMPQIVWTALPDGEFDYHNRRWYEYSGRPEATQEHAGWPSSLDPEDCQNCLENWRLALKSGTPFQTECRLLEERSGRYRWHLIRAEPITDAEGHVLRWFGTCTDIDDQKRAEEEVRELNAALERRVLERTAQLQASNRELEAFSYSVSHDLRAPLRSIDAFSQLVREDYHDVLGEQGREYLEIVGTASRQMNGLIDDMLHLSRVTRGEMRRQPVDLSGLAHKLFTGLRLLEPKRKVEVVIAPGLKTVGDERLLRIALENLLNNAWKFTSKKAVSRIEFGSESTNGETAFFVRDNGAGFDMAYANKLFGAFQRLHSSNEFPGHGIGLATVQRIVNRHGGRIWATGSVDQGAAFHFTLPHA